MNDEEKSRLAELDAKLRAHEAKKAEARSGRIEAKVSAMNVAYRVIVELFAAIGVGAAIGFGLDWLFGTKPWFLVIMSLFGFAAGIRIIMETAKEVQRLYALQNEKESK